jgi:Dihydroprymidine dehydrogenase domain II, 4Fe-4S cluster
VSVSRPDVASLPDLAHGSARAGPVRERRPVYVDLLPPCNAGCPAGENIQAWLAHMQAGRHEQAWRELVADNPFPAIHGRVCYHPCETVCNRADLDSAVSIHAVERFLGDLALERGWMFEPPPTSSGKRVLVVGSGPSGLWPGTSRTLVRTWHGGKGGWVWRRMRCRGARSRVGCEGHFAGSDRLRWGQRDLTFRDSC